MTDYIPEPQIAVLDAGGQYYHLIARKVRELGVYADVRPAKRPPASSRSRKGIIISGGPGSVYEPGSPTVDAGIFRERTRRARHLLRAAADGAPAGRRCEKGDKGEYGLATLTCDTGSDPLFRGCRPAASRSG